LAIKWPKSKKIGLRTELAQNLDLFPTIMHSVFESKQLEKFKMDGNDLNGPLPQWRKIQMYCSEKGEIASLNSDMTMTTCQKSKD
jgi:arylsulfatase A-like enzyme